MKKLNIQISTILAGAFIILFMTSSLQNAEWEVPANAKAVKNPTDVEDDEGLAIGKELWAKHCKSCHGKEGYGDGSKASELETFPGDFASDEFQEQTDGALFYKLNVGRDEMPAFEKKIASKEDRWLLVNYMRTLE